MATCHEGHHHLTSTPAELRLYALTQDLDFVDSSFELNIACQGYCISMNKQLNGWMRGAHVLASDDVDVLDAHAATVLVGWDLTDAWRKQTTTQSRVV